MQEVIAKASELWQKIQLGNLKAFTFSDVIWFIGIAVLLIIAAKIGFKLMKVILVILAIAVIIGFLIVKGIIPI